MVCRAWLLSTWTNFCFKLILCILLLIAIYCSVWTMTDWIYLAAWMACSWIEHNAWKCGTWIERLLDLLLYLLRPYTVIESWLPAKLHSIVMETDVYYLCSKKALQLGTSININEILQSYSLLNRITIIPNLSMQIIVLWLRISSKASNCCSPLQRSSWLLGDILSFIRCAYLFPRWNICHAIIIAPYVVILLTSTRQPPIHHHQHQPICFPAFPLHSQSLIPLHQPVISPITQQL